MTQKRKDALFNIIIFLYLLGGTVTGLSVPKYLCAAGALGLIYFLITGYEKTWRAKGFNVALLLTIVAVLGNQVPMSEQVAKIILILMCYLPVRAIQRSLL